MNFSSQLPLDSTKRVEIFEALFEIDNGGFSMHTRDDNQASPSSISASSFAQVLFDFNFFPLIELIVYKK